MICKLRISHWTILPALSINDCLQSLLLKKTKEGRFVNWSVTQHIYCFYLWVQQGHLKITGRINRCFSVHNSVWDFTLCFVSFFGFCFFVFFFCVSTCKSIPSWFCSFLYLNLSLQCRLFAAWISSNSVRVVFTPSVTPESTGGQRRLVTSLLLCVNSCKK